MTMLVKGSCRSKLIAVGCSLISGILLSQMQAYSDDSGPTVTIVPRLPRGSARAKTAIRVDVNLVLIPVMVTDPYQRVVSGLRKQDFRLFEDGVQQNISQFFNGEEPVSIGIVFDASNSMHNKIAQSRQAIREVLNLSLPGDEFFLLKFSDRPESVCAFTTNVHEIEDGLESIQPGGWTSLYDAIYVGISHLKHANLGRKVLLVLSDGGDNDSRYTEREMKELVKESDVRIFAISVFEKSPSLNSIAEESGGRAFRVRNLNELPDLAAKLSSEIHSEYVLGYSPTNRERDGKYRQVKVELLPPQDVPRPSTSWKHGYYSPVE
ncbi:MAG TPA: VWA domain-containing protein [Bryobacteraceae bacterium]|nr:VWA domain-containing protein [Bryobacteraceae bacterium]